VDAVSEVLTGRPAEPRPKGVDLTERETEVLRRLAAGRSI
jgi:DNA-binding CsgD family transcriptional regulator